jgi:hypothetical protein
VICEDLYAVILARFLHFKNPLNITRYLQFPIPRTVVTALPARTANFIRDIKAIGGLKLASESGYGYSAAMTYNALAKTMDYGQHRPLPDP